MQWSYRGHYLCQPLTKYNFKFILVINWSVVRVSLPELCCSVVLNILHFLNIVQRAAIYLDLNAHFSQVNNHSPNPRVL